MLILDSMKMIETELMNTYNESIIEVSYRKEAFAEVNNEYEKRLFNFIVFFGGLLLIVAIGMINNTIRLALYSKRFTIKTMQLVGATHQNLLEDHFYGKPLGKAFYLV